MYKFDSEAFIKEMEELNKGIEENPLDYEEFESWYEEYQQETERGLKGDLQNMLLENRALEITDILDQLEYELKIAILNDRLLDAEGIEIEIEELENELLAMGY